MAKGSGAERRLHHSDDVRISGRGAARRFLNGTGVCLRVEGHEGEAHELDLVALPAGWEVATTLSARVGAGAHAFVAADYDEFVDHPVELGRFWRGRFEAAGVPHEF